MSERARVSHNRRVPRKAQIAALLPALFLEDYIINIAGLTFSMPDEVFGTHREFRLV